MIREITLSDVPRAAEIHTFGWRDAYRGIVSDDILFNKMLVSQRIYAFSDAVNNNTEETYVFDDGIIKGILTIGACRDNDKADSFELWGIYIEPFMKRQGIGTEMVRFCEEKVVARGYREICLWVLEKNISARAFYEKLGYTADGKRKWLDALDVMEIRYHKYI